MTAQVYDVKSKIVDLILAIVERREVKESMITIESRLQEDLGFDSLELAELSAALEEDFGSDPYSRGQTPQTIAELLAFYEA